jgi:hypothetical protein
MLKAVCIHRHTLEAGISGSQQALSRSAHKKGLTLLRFSIGFKPATRTTHHPRMVERPTHTVPVPNIRQA